MQTGQSTMKTISFRHRFASRSTQVRVTALSTHFLRTLKAAIFTCFFAAACRNYAGDELSVSNAAPKFEATADSGTQWKSDEHVGHKVIVLYFYPASFTGGCTAQARAFRDDMKTFANKNVEIIGMSGDAPKTLAAFKKLNALNFTLLSDANGEVAKMFGVPTKPGGTVKQKIGGHFEEFTRGVTIERWTFVIDKAGKVAYKNTKVNPARDSKAVLDLLDTFEISQTPPGFRVL
jgi:peroxiredoxin Q/BCP